MGVDKAFNAERYIIAKFLIFMLFGLILSSITSEDIKVLVSFSSTSTFSTKHLHALSEFGMTRSSVFPDSHGSAVCC